MRVLQILPAVEYGDATGNDALAIREILLRNGYETGIYSPVIDSRIPLDVASGMEALPELNPEDILLYHFVTGTDLNRQFMKLTGKKVLIYHNITPPYFFARYNSILLRTTAAGYEDIHWLSDRVDYCICDSEYNREQLSGMGFDCPMSVCPILIPFSDYEKTPAPGILGRYREDGTKNILFVGRVAPNKRFDELIRAFSVYTHRFEKNARLILVGSSRGFEDYDRRLREYAGALGVQDQVLFTGHISFEEILAYYHLADLFLCMSEHEGFCVPLVEAMYFRVPIVAYAAAAIPDTLGRGGMLVRERDADLTAAVMHRVMTDEPLRREIAAGQEEQLEQFGYARTAERLIGCIHEIERLGRGKEREKVRKE